MDPLQFNKDVIEEFRANDGVCGGPFAGMPMILVTMTGAKSGRELCSPLVHSVDAGDPVIIASKAGPPEHLNWYYNLVANPQVTIEVGTEKWEGTAHLTGGDERRPGSLTLKLRRCRSSPSTRRTRRPARSKCSASPRTELRKTLSISCRSGA